MRILLISLILCLTYTGLYAQVDTTATDTSIVDTLSSNPEMILGFTPGPLLDAYQLRNAKWYTSINEAIREPEKVYKLSLSGQKYKNLPPSLDRFFKLAGFEPKPQQTEDHSSRN